ncbi:MAG: DNA-directed RNA polymerase subunit alpha C-terminal domain-containing protein, partial [Clostridia bacterium]|nr:DNA-directed RNA polymerase subunit alpha C-terminal domain-containing protein [Clostridia bacterium]
MNKNELLSMLINSEKKVGLVPTLDHYFGNNLNVQVGYSKSSCEAGIDELCLSVRSINALKRASVFTVRDAVTLINGGSLEKIRNLGRKSI